ncbi:hypothetical protein J2S43_004689 [Catenuloplanes nepalensis]|uniref:Uncharacterized protein n=1 Tax=Catenuloplanes nepalensis TaxID=587533 RepID=A0ABT9MXL4_9ACTN|nr:hypothetical protein [Catenuloplanes nepalensis]MDP9796177.1 hypothetical protein [Catenuloplanes nepalensis]
MTTDPQYTAAGLAAARARPRTAVAMADRYTLLTRLTMGWNVSAWTASACAV